MTEAALGWNRPTQGEGLIVDLHVPIRNYYIVVNVENSCQIMKIPEDCLYKKLYSYFRFQLQ